MFVRQKLKKFDVHRAIYILRNPLLWALSYYIFFKIAHNVELNLSEEELDKIRYKYHPDQVLSDPDYYLTEFFSFVLNYHTDLKLLYSIFDKNDIYINHLDQVFVDGTLKKWIGLNDQYTNNIPYNNVTSDFMYQLFGNDQIYEFWKSFLGNNKVVKSYIKEDCQKVKRDFNIDLLKRYELNYEIR
jgi:hypothetical protein